MADRAEAMYGLNQPHVSDSSFQACSAIQRGPGAVRGVT